MAHCRRSLLRVPIGSDTTARRWSKPRRLHRWFRREARLHHKACLSHRLSLHHKRLRVSCYALSCAQKVTYARTAANPGSLPPLTPGNNLTRAETHSDHSAVESSIQPAPAPAAIEGNVVPTTETTEAPASLDAEEEDTNAIVLDPANSERQYCEEPFRPNFKREIWRPGK